MNSIEAAFVALILIWILWPFIAAIALWLIGASINALDRLSTWAAESF